MRNEVHNSIVRFRVNDALLVAASTKAKQEGMSVSELMRAALRRELKN